ESLRHARFTVEGEGGGGGQYRERSRPVAPDRKSEIITELGSLQLSHMRSHRFTQRLEVVTAFHTRDNAAAAGFAGPVLDDPSHLYKIIVSQKQLAQRIAAVRVKAGRDNYEVGPKL